MRYDAALLLRSPENSGNIGAGPFTVVVTDVNESSVSFTVSRGSGAIDTGAQFPVCD